MQHDMNASELCELLIKHGAEVNRISNGFYGVKMTALDYALCDKVKDRVENSRSSYL